MHIERHASEIITEKRKRKKMTCTGDDIPEDMQNTGYRFISEERSMLDPKYMTSTSLPITAVSGLDRILTHASDEERSVSMEAKREDIEGQFIVHKEHESGLFNFLKATSMPGMFTKRHLTGILRNHTRI